MDIRVERTRELLRRALDELLEERDIEDISVSEICKRSTVRRATFYRHFEDKQAFFEWYLQTIAKRFLLELEEVGDCSDLETYTELMHRKLIEFVCSRKSMMRRRLGKTTMAGSLDTMMGEIAVGIAERIVSHAEERGLALDASPQFRSLFYSGGMMHTLRWWIAEDAPCSADELIARSTDFLMRYMRGLPPLDDSPTAAHCGKKGHRHGSL